MKKRIRAVILSVCILLSCGLTAFAQNEESKTPCLHENAQWELLAPVNSASDMRATLKCMPDNITSEFPYKLYTLTGGNKNTFC